MRNPKEREIAVFDSGVGGLTVYKELRRVLPKERLVYFGDTARLPYGSKSKEVVTRFSLEIARFLERRRIKLLVVACNTATALALPAIRRGLRVPVLGVVDPMVDAALRGGGKGPIGVVGTEATVRSGAYAKALKRKRPGIKVFSKPCPLWVPLIEEGWWDHPVTREVAKEYLRPLKKAGLESLILGCTHYPLIKPILSKVLGRGVRLIDSGEEAAVRARELLRKKGWLRESGGASDVFFVTDGAERVRKLIGRFLGGKRPSVRMARLPL